MTAIKTPSWRIHAHEPYWMPEPDFDAVMDWLIAHRINQCASAAYDVAVVEIDGRRMIECADDDGKQTTVPLRVDPPDIPRPDVPYLAQLQDTLAGHLRTDLPPGAVLAFGDCLAEEHGQLRPGGTICWECSQASVVTRYVAWPCRLVAEAAKRSGVELW